MLSPVGRVFAVSGKPRSIKIIPANAPSRVAVSEPIRVRAYLCQRIIERPTIAV